MAPKRAKKQAPQGQQRRSSRVRKLNQQGQAANAPGPPQAQSQAPVTANAKNAGRPKKAGTKGTTGKGKEIAPVGNKKAPQQKQVGGKRKRNPADDDEEDDFSEVDDRDKDPDFRPNQSCKARGASAPKVTKKAEGQKKAPTAKTTAAKRSKGKGGKAAAGDEPQDDGAPQDDGSPQDDEAPQDDEPNAAPDPGNDPEHPHPPSDAESDSAPLRGNLRVADFHRVKAQQPSKRAKIATTEPLEWQPPNAPQFEHIKDLGVGGFGKAMLFAQLDENRTIIDRFVVKDTYPGHHQWVRARMWCDDGTQPGQKAVVEIEAMRLLTERMNALQSFKCVRLIRHFTDVQGLRYRIYMHYSPYGSLYDLLRNRYSLDKAASDQPIPEPVIWKWFEDLTEACFLLGYGGIEAQDRVRGWKKIVHCDLKSQNIFLDEPNSNGEWPSIKSATVGDFGISIFTDKRDPLNPSLYNDGVGTTYWRAPEQPMWWDEDTREPMHVGQLSDATNVWGIGAIIMRAMDRTFKPDDADYAWEDGLEPEFAQRGAGEIYNDYSRQLIELVLSCVSFQPQNRMTLRELRAAIKRYTGAGSGDSDDRDDGDDDEGDGGGRGGPHGDNRKDGDDHDDDDNGEGSGNGAGAPDLAQGRRIGPNQDYADLFREDSYAQGQILQESASEVQPDDDASPSRPETSEGLDEVWV